MLYDQIFFTIIVSIFFTINFYKAFKAFFKNHAIPKYELVPVSPKPQQPTSTSALTAEQQAQKDKYEKRNAFINFIKLVINAYCSFNNSFIFIGMISETYLVGAKFYANCFSIALGYIYAALIFHPFITDMDVSIKSPYDYISKRYRNCKWTRAICGFIGSWFYFGFVSIYLSSSAVFLATLFPTIFTFWSATFLLGVFSMLGLIFGGYTQSMKINLMQFLVFVFGTLVGILVTFYSSKEFTSHELWELAYKIGRRKFYDLTVDLTTKYTIISQFLSLPLPWVITHCLIIPTFNRYRAIKPNIKSRIFLISNLPVMLIVNLVLVMGGIACAVFFYGCDPRATKEILNKNQIPAYWILKSMSDKAPTIAGICLAGSLCFAIFQHSSGMMVTANAIISEIVEPLNLNRFYKSSVIRTNIFTFSVRFFVGCLGILYATSFLYAKTNIITFFFYHNNSFNAPIFGIFILSMFNPYANKFGALFSLVTIVAINVWLCIGSLFFIQRKNVEFPIETFNCPTHLNLNHTLLNRQPTKIYPEHPHLFYAYSVVSIWFGVLNLIYIIVVGTLASFLYSLVKTRSLDSDSDFKEERKKYLYNVRRHLLRFK